MNNRIIFIIGGARSGKSSFALSEASKTKGLKAYIATAEVLDNEMRGRIERHKKSRGDQWDTYEEPLKIDTILTGMKNKYSVIVLDCLTLWLSNVLLRSRQPENAINEFLSVLIKFKNSSLVTHHSSLFIVSNEVGMGIVPDNRLARRFRDLAGWLHQEVAEVAHKVYMVTAGIPVKIK